jgi:tripartite-type tricarboxylate transporter receptor subunit TctC
MRSRATTRRTILAAGAALPFIARGAAAQGARPITLVVPYAPGGGTDLTAREFAHGFSEALGGQTVIVENRGGAAGHIGSVGVARARPDGTTLLFAVSTNLVVNPHMQRDGSNLVRRWRRSHRSPPTSTCWSSTRGCRCRTWSS